MLQSGTFPFCLLKLPGRKKRDDFKYPEQVKIKAKASLDNISVKNNLILVAEEIEDIYNEALHL